MRRLMAARSASKLWPRISIWPAVGSSRPVRQPMVVLLPEPLGPRKPNMVPGATDSDKPSTAVTVPYFFTRFVIRMASIRSALSLDDDEQLLPPRRQHFARAFERCEVKRRRRQDHRNRR